MHKHWSQIKNIYIESNRIFSYQRLKDNGRKRDLLPALGALFLMVAISSTLYLFNNPVWPMACLTGIAFCMIVFFKSIEAQLSKYYPEEYEEYEISQRPWAERIDYLAYVFFLQKIKKLGYTPAKLKAVMEYSETLSFPPKPFMINQHFLTVILISVLISLSSAYIQKTQAWSAQGWIYVWAIASLSVLVSLALDGFRTAQTRDSRIRRYVRRAQIELEQELNEQTDISICKEFPTPCV